MTAVTRRWVFLGGTGGARYSEGVELLAWLVGDGFIVTALVAPCLYWLLAGRQWVWNPLVLGAALLWPITLVVLAMWALTSYVLDPALERLLALADRRR